MTESAANVLRRAWETWVRTCEGAGFTLHVGVRAAWGVGGALRRRDELARQMAASALSPLPVALVVALFSGMILALQAGIQLARFGQEPVIGLIVASSMCREMGPFITAIVLTATVGSAIAAEIGTMRVSEEIDALEVMAIDPVRFLATPRILALTLTAPLLTAMTDAVGMLGGALVSYGQLGVSFVTFFDAARTVLESPDRFLPKDIYTGLVKAMVFGATIASVGCSQGLRAKGGALGVGRATRRSVIQSFLLVLVLGYVLTWIFYR